MSNKLYQHKPLGRVAKTESEVFKLELFSVANDAIPLKENWAERWATLPKTYEHVMDEVLGFEMLPDDVMLLTFPKCGTTWMQEAAWLLLNNLDYDKAAKIIVSDRSPNLDGSGAVPRTPSTMQQVRDLPRPRLIKSHLPTNLIPLQAWENKSKMIFVARNVKDLVVSNYTFFSNLRFIVGSMDDFVDDFISSSVLYMPYLERVVDFYKMRNEPNIFFTTYEDMQRDLTAVINRLCDFLGRPKLNDDEMKKLRVHLSFDKMKENKKSNIEDYLKTTTPVQPEKGFQFMRKGVVGSYKNELSPANQEKLDKWANEVLSAHNLTVQEIFGDF